MTYIKSNTLNTMSKNLYAIVLSLTAILYSTNCIYAYTGTDPGWFDEITDVYDNGMTYNLSNKTIITVR